MWIEKLRDRFADRQMLPPDGLWDDISAAMPDMGKTGKKPLTEKHKYRAILMPLRRIAVWAACAVVVVSVWLVAGGYDGGNLSDDNSVAASFAGSDVADGTTDTGGDVNGNSIARELPDKVNRMICNVGSSLKERLHEVKSAEEERLAVNGDSRLVDDNDARVKEKVNESLGNKTERRVYNDDDLLKSSDLMAVNTKKENANTLSFSVHVSGMAAVDGMSNNSAGYGKAFVSSGGMMLDENVFSVMQLSNPEEMKTDGASTLNVKHKLPIKAGLSFKYGLTGRLAVSSGVNYSYLSSDMSSGDDGGGVKTEQTLHYISVPLGVSYQLFRSGRLEVYASGGVEAAFCLSGKADTKCFVDGKMVSRHKEDVKDSKPQWSVNAAAGVQYNITDKLGVYAEPGLGYYFNNGSSTNTIYKDRPLDFNLNVGLRFSVK